MNPNAVKHLVILFLCMLGAVILGATLAYESYENLLFLSYAIMAIYVIAVPGYVPLIAIGLLNPFMLPIPYIFNLPFLLLVLGFCFLKYFFQRALQRHRVQDQQNCFTWGFVLFFGWVALRYAMKPALPNIAGFGQNVTGFRSYLDYGLCFALVLLLPLLLTSRGEVLRLIRWMGGISVFFILFLVPFTLSKSLTAAEWLNRFGLFVALFDNGWLRFVVLPGFGLVLLMLALLPDLAPFSLRSRILMLLLGSMAIVLGGNRSGVVMAFISVLVIALARRRMVMFASLTVGIALALVVFRVVGERIDVSRGVGFLRVMSLTSGRLAYRTEAAGNIEWRMLRWRRAMQEIRANPLFGKGYGGVENAWIVANRSEVDAALFEVGMATGGIHNGYLSAAYSLGIPSLLLFLAVLGTQMLANFKQALRLRSTDPVLSDLHTFVLGNLAALAATIYIGTDVNAPIIWFYLALGVLLVRLRAKESMPVGSTQSEAVPPALSPRFSVG